MFQYTNKWPYRLALRLLVARITTGRWDQIVEPR